MVEHCAFYLCPAATPLLSLFLLQGLTSLPVFGTQMSGQQNEAKKEMKIRANIRLEASRKANGFNEEQGVGVLPGQEEVNIGKAWESWCLLRYL